MSDHLARAEDFESRADKKLTGWGLFGSKYEDAADLFDKAANAFKLAKSWDRAGAVYVKLANCHLKLDSKHEAANAYADAAHCYKKSNTKESITCLEESINLFLDIGRFNLSARYYKTLGFVPYAEFASLVKLKDVGMKDTKRIIRKLLKSIKKQVPQAQRPQPMCQYLKEIAELYEQEQNLEQAIVNYEKAADLFQSEEVSASANQCKQKVAQYAAQLEQYQKAIEIYEEIAQQSLNNTLLKYGVKGHLLNAGICQLCKADFVAINKALERYQDLDPTFSGTRECRLLAELATAIDEEDLAKFTDAVKEYDSMSQLDGWKTTLLLRVKEALKAKELEEDDLT